MLLRTVNISECWCPNCGAGQMEQIWQLTFAEKISQAALVGKKFICEKCKQENTIEDVVSIIPTSFLVSAKNEMDKIKSNQEIINWLKSE